jgi:hypothetical protein
MLLSFLRPTWTKLLLSAVTTVILGAGGLFLYFFSTCFAEAGHDCAAYSPFGVFVAYVLSWPVLALQVIFSPGLANHQNYDFVLFHRGGFLALWVYHYMLVCVLTSVVSRRSKLRYESS